MVFLDELLSDNRADGSSDDKSDDDFLKDCPLLLRAAEWPHGKQYSMFGYAPAAWLIWLGIRAPFVSPSVDSML